MPVCDIIVPVYNSLSYVRECLSSIIQKTSPSLYRLLIINDNSDEHTTDFLNCFCAENPRAEVLHNTENLGFVRSCNMGFSNSSAPYAVIVNSDVVVADQWLDRLINCAEQAPEIASVNPLTNRASQISIPIPGGMNFNDVNEFLQQKFSGKFADIVTGVGFCMLLRRKALEQAGYFDEIYGKGYCEESDLCMRLTTSGWRTVAAKDVYVYHKGRASFTCRDERYLKNRAIFDSRWSGEYKKQFKAFLKADPLQDVRLALRPFVLKPDFKPVIVQTGREVLGSLRKAKFQSALKHAVKGTLKLASARRELVEKDSLAFCKTAGKFSVTYILHNMVVAGGVLSVIQIVNQLIRLGIDARVAGLYLDPVLPEWTRMYTAPMIYKNPQELIKNLPDSDIFAATLWTSADWVRRLCRRTPSSVGLYFLQDYEPWFFPPEKTRERARVESTYSMLPHHIVKSEWLRDMVKQHHVHPWKISLGMDLGVFYPRSVKNNNQLSVLAMARPRTPRRGFSHLVQSLRLVKEKLPQTEIRLFGDSNLKAWDIPFEFTDLGIISNQNTLAEVYSASDVFLDASLFQGFGRCALEAMACGCTCVLTSAGGVQEYAKHNENCLLVNPADPQAMADSAVRLLEDPQLRSSLIQAGLETVQKFSHIREAAETLEYFQKLLSS